MADDGIYTKNADIQARCGVNANATSKATAATDVYVLNVESFINAETETNWSDLYTAGLNADVQGILTDVSASICAIYVINSDPDAIGRSTANFMVNILLDRVNRGMKTLKEGDKRGFIKNA